MGRFFLASLCASAVAIVLGLRLIDSLFDETKTLRTGMGLPSVAVTRELRPAGARNQLRVFFTEDGAALSPVIFAAKEDATPSARGRAALEYLLRGPSQGLLQSPVPKGVTLRGFYLLQPEGATGIEAVIDLSKEIRETPLGGLQSELLCVNAIVNTALANCELADSVRILIDGASANTLWGQVDLNGPLGQTPMAAPVEAAK